MTKVCRVCGLESDDLELFRKAAKGTDGRDNICKKCINEYRNRSNKARRKLISELKRGKPCYVCGNVFPPVVMDYHHTEPEDKYESIATMLDRSRSTEDILREITKCVLVCANCHRLIHYPEEETE